MSTGQEEIRDVNGYRTGSYFNYIAQAYNLGIAYQLGSHLRLGISPKFVLEDLYGECIREYAFDVGVAYSEKKSGYRISTRAKKYVCLKTGLLLGRILEDLSDDEISGGGHDGAAAIQGKEGLEELLAILIEKVKQSLSK